MEHFVRAVCRFLQVKHIADIDGMARAETESRTDSQPNLVYGEAFSHVIEHLGRCKRLPFRLCRRHHSLHPTAQMMLVTGINVVLRRPVGVLIPFP